jgi:hypothetical protein
MTHLRLEMDMVMIRAKKVGDIERKVEAEQLALKFRYEVQELQLQNVEKIKREIENVEELHKVYSRDEC